MSAPSPPSSGAPPEAAGLVETLMRAARNFAGVTAASLAQAEDVTLPQLRVLVLASRHGSLNNTAIAQALSVHLSNATRLCDRLVQAGLLNRQESVTDRRNVQLTLTAAGARLVDQVMDHRRAALQGILQQMPPAIHPALQEALDAFSDAAEATQPDRLPRF